jgi:hypothetical protein
VRPGEVLHNTHEYGCGRGMFYDLECSCRDGPRVTEQDLLDRAEGLPPKARVEPLKVSKAWLASSRREPVK